MIRCWLFWRSRADRDAELQAELRTHLEMAVALRMERGESREDAERHARLEFGNVTHVAEVTREMWGGGWLDVLGRDVQFAARGLRKSPTFALVAIVTLALGIGANAAMFSVVDAVLFRPLPWSRADHLVSLFTDDAQRGSHHERSPVSLVAAWRADNRTLEDLASYAVYRETLNEKGVRERLRAVGASTNLFTVLGVPPVLGRSFIPADSLGERVAVISNAFWRRRFNSDSAVAGQTFHLEAAGDRVITYRVIGVAAPDFFFPDKAVDFWTTAAVTESDALAPFDKGARRWATVARMKQRASLGDVRRDLAQIAKQLSGSYATVPPDFPGFRAAVQGLREDLTGERTDATLRLLLATVSLVMVIACANVASLILARGAEREHEFVIRVALGATRMRLASQLVVENLLLAGIGGTVGLGLAFFACKVLRVAAANALPRAENVTIDGLVLAFVAGVSVLSGAVVGLAPIVRVLRRDAGIALRDRGNVSGSRGAVRLRAMLVTAQCAVAVVLLTGAGLFLRSLDRLRGVAAGFDAGRVVDVRVEFPTVSPSAQAMRATIHAITSLDGVEAAGFIDDLFSSPSVRFINAEGRGVSTEPVNDARVTEGFFKTMRVPLLTGRYLTASDASAPAGEGQTDAATEPVVVNATFARRLFPGETAVGRVFRSGSVEKQHAFEIVGVIGDMHRQGREEAVVPEWYTAYVPAPKGRADLLVRAKAGLHPMQLSPALQSIVRARVPGSLVWYVRTVSDQFDDFDSARRVETWLLASFAALGLVLAVVGVYGIVQYGVTLRTREIGLRMALGASSAAIMRTTLKEGLRVPLVGIGIGLVAALWVTHLAAHLLFETSSGDPATYVLITALLGGAAATACLLAARRASRVDPMNALRQD